MQIMVYKQIYSSANALRKFVKLSWAAVLEWTWLIYDTAGLKISQNFGVVIWRRCFNSGVVSQMLVW